ncbi:hypothetical protein JTB14_003678 [Gonioctena quinquepunctata]|nr:hypothetical protein JTB14_003678 [Gonioctena quinquepunctata]
MDGNEPKDDLPDKGKSQDKENWHEGPQGPALPGKTGQSQEGKEEQEPGAQVFQPTLPIKICLGDTDRAHNIQNAGSQEDKFESDPSEEEFQPKNIGNTTGKEVIDVHSSSGSDNTPNNTPESSPPVFVDANSATPINTPKAQMVQPNFIIGKDKPGFTPNPIRNEGNFSYDSHISNIEDEGYLLQNLVTYTNEDIGIISDNMINPPGPSEVENTAGEGATEHVNRKEEREKKEESLISEGSPPSLNLTALEMVVSGEESQYSESGTSSASANKGKESVAPGEPRKRQYKRSCRMTTIMDGVAIKHGKRKRWSPEK